MTYEKVCDKGTVLLGEGSIGGGCAAGAAPGGRRPPFGREVSRQARARCGSKVGALVPSARGRGGRDGPHHAMRPAGPRRRLRRRNAVGDNRVHLRVMRCRDLLELVPISKWARVSRPRRMAGEAPAVFRALLVLEVGDVDFDAVAVAAGDRDGELVIACGDGGG